MKVSIISEQKKFEFITSQQYKTTTKLVIKYDNKQERVFFIPVEDKLTDIEVRDSKGRELSQLSPKELEEKFDISVSDVSSKENVSHDHEFIRIPVLLLPSDSEFETLMVTYTSPIDPKIYSTSNKSLNMKIKFGLRISPSEFVINSPKYVIEKTPYDIHITINAGDDYKIQKDCKITVTPKGRTKITTQSKRIPNLVKFHISEMGFESDVLGSVIIRIADSTANAAAAVSIAGIIVPVLLVMGQIVVGELFLPTLEILVGVIVILIGSRMLVIQDKYIMNRWIGLYRVILAVNALAFFIWFLVWMMKNYGIF